MTKFSLLTALFLLLLCVPVFAQQTTTPSNPTAPMQAFLSRAAENGYAGSVLVASKGNVLLEQGYGMADREAGRPQNAETLFSVGSITKQFTAAAIIKLWSQQKLQLNDPLSKFFPEAPADKANMTIHQLLTHTAGWPDAIGDDYDNLNAEAFARLALSVKLENPPGATYQYSNVGYSMLGIIVEKVSGMGYERFLREQLWLPAGMTHTGYVLPAFTSAQLAVGYQNGNRWGTALDHPWLADGPGWHLRANGGVISSVGELYKWYTALKNNTVLPKSATDLLFTPHIAEDPAGRSFYGYGWVVQDEGGQRMIWHNGGNGVYNAFMGFDLANDQCIIVSSNSNNKISDGIAHQLQLMLNGGGAMFDQAIISRFTGRYQLPSGAAFEARIDESNNLTVILDEKESLTLLLADGTEQAAETTPVGVRTVNMLEGVKADNFTLLAKYRDIPVATAIQRAQPFWDKIQEERGAMGNIDLLGVVARHKEGLMLAFVRVNFEKSAQYFMYTWKGEFIEDAQPRPLIDKIYECTDGKSTFYAANIDRTIVLENINSGTPALRIKLPGGDVLAVRTGDSKLLIKQDEEAPEYSNNPVTHAIYQTITDQGAAYFTQNSRQILTKAGFDFKDDMQLLGVGERLEAAAKWTEAIALFETYTQLFPRIVVAWNRLGKCREAIGNTVGARAAWEKSVALRPANNPAVEWLKKGN